MSNTFKPNLRIGLLNMMADGALKATERQFLRLLSGQAVLANADLRVFSLEEIPRSSAAQDYITKNYENFAVIQKDGLDALMITGVNLMDPQLEIQPFWIPLQKVFAWAADNGTSTLCSCLATHAVLQFHFGQKRKLAGRKLWGVFEQELKLPEHPLVQGLPAKIHVPHSRHNDISGPQFEAAGLQVLIAGGGAGVHLAASCDLKLVLMQGHPEYDTISLLKEYKREVASFHEGLRPDFPPHLEGVLTGQGIEILDQHRQKVEAARLDKWPLPEFPEAQVSHHLVNSWAEPTATFFANWLNLVATGGLEG